MRKKVWLAGLVAVLWAGRPAAAQSAISWGPTIGTYQFVVATNPADQPIAQPMSVGTGFRLQNLFPSPASITNQQVPGFSIFPTQGQMPGVGYLSLFGMQMPGRRPWWQFWW